MHKYWVGVEPRKRVGARIHSSARALSPEKRTLRRNIRETRRRANALNPRMGTTREVTFWKSPMGHDNVERMG